MTQLTQEKIEALIEVGRYLPKNKKELARFFPDPSINEIETIDLKEEFYELDFKRKHWFLFRGFVWIENLLDWPKTENACSIRLYKTIRRKNYDRPLILARWARSVTKNPYLLSFLPATSVGAISYTLQSDSLGEWVTCVYDLREYAESLDSLTTDQSDKINMLSRQLEKEKQHSSELRYRLQLAEMSNQELIKTILEDHSRPIYFYEMEIRRILNEPDISTTDLQLFLKRFKDKERRNGKRLKREVEKAFHLCKAQGS
ncbi:hypothetical protein [Robertkochia aurantiaca]|uniref:hypothetical protein n=1 Tax=Robertkochia aurantiaca TaxID=2873700 RepID=UPI001CD034D9|nr:hypothetical protein [Robertkochia sp. 3YJGBD-33]